MKTSAAERLRELQARVATGDPAAVDELAAFIRSLPTEELERLRAQLEEETCQ